MANITLTLNAKAAEFIGSNQPTKMRVDATLTKAEGIRFRPTTRKAGPHILLDLIPKGRGLVMEISEEIYEKMITDGLPSSFFQPGEKYSVISDKYGWTVFVPGEDHEASVGTATFVANRKNQA